MCARTVANEPVAEDDRAVIDKLCGLETAKLAVTAMLRDHVAFGAHAFSSNRVILDVKCHGSSTQAPVLVRAVACELKKKKVLRAWYSHAGSFLTARIAFSAYFDRI